MWCFSCCTEDDDDDDPSKIELKTAMMVSRYEPEDRRVRQEMGVEEQIDLLKEKQEKDLIRSAKPKEKGKRKQDDADDQKHKQLSKSHKDKGPKMYSKDDLKVAVNRSAANISDRGKSLSPQGLCCQVCHEPFDVDKIAKKGKYHEDCYKERYKCNVCKGELPLNEKRHRECNWHQFWKKNYCPVHDKDGTPKCCSCERLQPQDETTYVMLEDGRWLCRECMESAYLAWDECQHLQFDMREFFQGLNMKIDKEFPFLLVEKQALNKAEKEEKIDQRYEAVTRGICLSEEQWVDSVTKKPIKGPNNKLIGMAKESVWVERKCEVTGVLILYGLPRLLTGYILAHEMMHAYLRLNGHRNLNEVLEEGLCQVLGHMWLESQRYAAADASSSVAVSSSSSRTPADNASKKGEWSDFEKQLVGFCQHQIETDDSPVYGRGFKVVNKMVTESNLPEILKIVIRSGKTIPDSESK